jgi:hemoglobin
MRSLKLFTLTCLLTAMFSIAATAQTKTLYERLGGKESITAVVNEFAGRVLADTRINQKFAKTDPTRLTTQLIEQICAATGGPCQYTGRDMTVAHAKMGVTNGEFNALVEDLVGALDKFNVPETEKNELLAALGPMKAQIVEIQSDATGTPLPAKYKNFTAGKGGKGGKAKAEKVEKVKEEKVKGSKGKKMKETEAEAPKETAPAEAPAADAKAEKKTKKKTKN